MVLLRDGRTLIGYLRSVDQFANLVLHRTIERIHVGKEYGDIPRGVFIVRGENVVLLGEIVCAWMMNRVVNSVHSKHQYLRSEWGRNSIKYCKILKFRLILSTLMNATVTNPYTTVCDCWWRCSKWSEFTNLMSNVFYIPTVSIANRMQKKKRIYHLQRCQWMIF